MNQDDYDPAWRERRGAVSGMRPILWGCTGCGYTFFAFSEEQDPQGDGHCCDAIWVADERALDAKISAPNRNAWWAAPQH